MIGKYKLSLCNTGKLCHLSFLPEMSIDAMLDNRHAEHF